MKKGIIVILALLAAAAAGFLFFKGSGGAPGPERHAHEPKTMYNCAMHPQYISDKPGNCPICGMKLTPMNKSGAAPDAPVPSGSSAEGKIAYYRDPMHPWITSDKPGKSPDCGMEMVPVYAGEGNAAGVHIDPTTVQNMGVRTEAVQRRDLQTEIRTNGKVKVDESKLTLVNARVMGYAEKLNVNVTGQKVAKGQSLLEIYSPDLVSTQEEFLQALRYARGMEGAGGSEGPGSRDLVESSRRRLLNWGISSGEIQALEKSGRARNTLAIASPASGVVLEKMVVQGQNIMPGMELYKIADLSRVWVVANVYQRDLAVAKVGGEAEVELSYLPGKPFKGKVTFISPVLDEQTKTAEVRIEVPNTPSLDFKPEMFATVRILSATHRNAVAVPDQSIIRSGRRTIAIVATGGGYFEPREVKLGAAANDYVEVLEGLHEGEKLVISSQFLIDSESNLKAAIQQLQAAPMADSAASMENGAPDMGGGTPDPAMKSPEKE
jgi:multidrug efflux pump subunit AcrA (membrane-fusion protein)